MKSDTSVFRTFSQFFIHATHRLQQLSCLKNIFSKEINYQVNPFFDLVKKQLNSAQIKAKSFAQLFQIDIKSLLLTLFRQNNKPVSKLSPERLCTYLKTSTQNLKKTYTIQAISRSKIMEFVTIVKNQIQILVQTKKILKQNQAFLQKLFEQIDFFSNKYIDCASFAELFNHYSQPGDKPYSETGCIMLIEMIKGYESVGEKLYLEDLLEFVHDKENFAEEEPEAEQVLLDKKNSKESIDFSCILQKSDFSSSNKNNESLEYKTSSRRTCRKSSIDQQSIIPRRSDKSIEDSEMAVNLSISQSMSPRSAKNREFFGLGNSFHKTFHQESIKQFNMSTGHRFSFAPKNYLDDLQKDNKKDFIKNQHEYHVQDRFDKVQDKQKYEMNQKPSKVKKSVFQQIAQLQKKTAKVNYYPTFQSSPFKSFLPDHSCHIPSALRQQKKLVYGSSLSNNFESSLIRSHSRNLAYLSQVKLSDRSCPKVIDNCESTTKNRTKNLTRPCLSSKVSLFQTKKVQFVFTLQSLVEEYARWYAAVEQLVMKKEKFTFFSAFSVIDVNQTNEVTFNEFKDFLKDAGIQKRYDKIQFFFNRFSIFKSALKKEGENKQNVCTQKQKQLDINALKISKFQEKVMRFSDFLKIFYLQKTIQLLTVCKKRPAIVQQKWEQHMKSSYCNLFRVVMDSCYQIQSTLKNLKQIYTQMKQTWPQETFQKTFGRQIMRFDEMQKILGLNSTTLLCQISKDEQYIDEQKLMKFIGMELTQMG